MTASLRRAACVAVAVGATLVARTADAQEEPPPTDRTGSGYFLLGGALLDMDDLNAALSGAGHPSVEDRALTVGGGGHARFGRAILGGEGHGFIVPSDDGGQGTHRTRLAGGAGFLNLGYLAVGDGRWQVFPFVGLGGGMVQVRLDQRAVPSFDEVLAQPRRSSELGRAMFLAQLALGVDRKVFPPRGSGRWEGVMVGMRAGYVLAPFSGDWRLGNIDIGGGPDADLRGPYVRIAVGGWGEGPVRAVRR